MHALIVSLVFLTSSSFASTYICDSLTNDDTQEVVQGSPLIQVVLSQDNVSAAQGILTSDGHFEAIRSFELQLTGEGWSNVEGTTKEYTYFLSNNVSVQVKLRHGQNEGYSPVAVSMAVFPEVMDQDHFPEILSTECKLK